MLSLRRGHVSGGALNVRVILGLLAVATGYVDSPFLRSRLPLGDDTEIHLYRLVDLDRLIREGILFSRWQPDQVYGYGSPLFSFYAPLSAYLAEAGHLFGASFRGGMILLFAAMPLVAGTTTYAFLRRRLTAGAALLGAVAYVAGLYFLYDIFVRGSISDALAMALFPVVLLALDWLCECPGPCRVAIVAVAGAALLLSHNVSGPVLLPLLVLCGWWWTRHRRLAAVCGVVAVALAIGLDLFFLGPAALDVADTRVPEWLAEPGTHFDQHFVAVADLFVLRPTVIPGAMLTNLPLGIGLVQFLAGLAALPGLRRLKQRPRGEVIVFAGCMVVCAFLTTSASGLVWSTISILQIVPYPWRLLAVAAFADALLIGYAAEAWLPRQETVAGLALGVSSLVLLLLAVPYLYPLPGESLPPNPSLGDVTAFQQRSGALGTTSDSEFLPRGLTEFPSGPAFPGADRGASLGQKLDPASVPIGARIQVLGDGPLATRLAVTSPTQFEAHFFVFRFPGWSATLDDQPLALASPGRYQTLNVPVPAGPHVVALSFGETRRRQIFDLVSIISALAIVVLFAASLFKSSRMTWSMRGLVRLVAHGTATNPLSLALERGSAGGEGSAFESRYAVSAVVVAVLVVITLIWTVFDRVDTPLVRSYDGQRPPGMAIASDYGFGDSLDLLGYTAPSTEVHLGHFASFDLYWRARAPLHVNYSSFVHIVAPDGYTVAQADNVHIADFPTTRWRLGAYARDVHRVQIPATAVPGSYRVAVGVYDRASGRQLLAGRDGGPVADSVTLPPLVVVGP